MRIAMIGAGYVGLVSGACLADFGHTVVCIDRDPDKIASLNAGRMPIYEPGLDVLVAENVRQGRLAFRATMRDAVAEADAVFIAVGTPSRRGDGFADLSYVFDAAREIAGSLSGFTVVVTKSTVPVGTGDEVERIIRETNPEAQFAVASNPEFLREGAAIADFKRPDRIVVGAEEARAEAVMREVYRPLYLNQAPIMVTSRRTAELTKYAANAFLAAKITFINEVADLCEAVGADVQAVARGIGLDNRIGPKFLHAGPGYGGSCFPKDTLALVKTAQDAGTPLRLVETVVAVNDQRKRAMARKVIKACGGSVRGKTIALLGLTFKPNTDDMRDAPALAIVAGLQDAGAVIRAYDPEGMEQARILMPAVDYAENAYACAEGADAVVIVTEWNAFRALDLDRLRQAMSSGEAAPVLIDLRNIYDPASAARHGFTYCGVGRTKESVARIGS
ncbi:MULTISPECIES: UDP-glucose/GDP-mannose dehydrogenase family protein [Methylobacterium]|uniref:UDP-glucose dehydrogenase family protein n=2 Tax=Methylobacteriaceae TaxID=119045 RepID=UPI0003A747C4|nr:MULTISPECIES: UDP-glucose/GDP-mannose dehydrogenase family protein [Methylobacterium]MBN4094442.1 UDP-glucose/GDP-mannose dehydrogenase family protein [Methylobacterium sp. OT2]UIN33141.1 UDP-glucose/GDP-mannose dehydrogenase family protein [Methylobacterium oryzae]